MLRTPMRAVSAARPVLLLLAAATLPLSAAVAQEPAVSGGRIDFSRDIAPIFAAHCHGCHGPERAENDLRLDDPIYLREAAESPFPILGPTLETNEIYQRITSEDPAFRMPWKRPPLSDAEINTIRRWIEQGVPLGLPPEGEQAGAALSPPVEEFLRSFYEQPYGMLLLALFLAANVAILAVERRKRRWKTSGPAGVRAPITLRVGLVHYLLVWALFALAFGVLFHNFRIGQERALRQAAEARVDQARAEAAKFQPGMDVELQYGNPPVPVRMDHPKAMEREYYRGNDERSPKLYNGGHYRTSTMQVRLVRADGEPVQVGDEFPGGHVSVEFVFDRAPNTEPVLYSNFIMENTDISNRYPWSEAAADPKRTGVEEVEPGRKWRMRYPVAMPERPGDSVQGLVYIYYRGKIHYGLGYDIRIVDGRVAEGSDVWLGNLWVSQKLLPHFPPKFVTQREWLDYRPIPIIPEGENVEDPELLGVGEHLQAAPNPE